MPVTDQGTDTINGEVAENVLPFRTKISAMEKQLETLIKSLTSEQLAQYDLADLSVRLDFVDQINASFEDAQSALEEILTVEQEYNGRLRFTTLYLDAKAKLTRRLNVIQRSESNLRSSTMRQFSIDGGSLGENSSAMRKTRLPEIQLPKFSGGYADWPNFFSLFTTVVDSSTDLSVLEKFHHLRSSLTGIALDTVSSLELTEKNYAEASHIKELFSLKPVENGSAVGLRHLSDKMNSHLRAMMTITSKGQIADGLLIYLATSKMDRAAQIKWEESLVANELPSWSSMSSFLDQRCRMLENLEHSVTNMDSTHQNTKKQNPKNRHVHVAAGAKSPSCVFCCCRQCSSKHHTMLHMEQPSTPHPSTSSQPVEPSSTLAVLTSSTDISSGPSSSSSGSVLLATAIILAKNRFGEFIPCRAILDSASQLNLIANRLVKRLSLDCHRVSATISGIGDGSVDVNKSVDLVVKSRIGEFSTTFAAMVVPTITDYQPGINLETSNWNIPKNIQLADPSFDKPDRIDILIGAELFFDLMSVGQIKIAANLPVLQKTLLGWVVAGGSFRSRQSCSLAVIYTDLKEEEAQLSTIIKGFWEIETNFKPIIEEDTYCETHFVNNFVRLPTGEYSVRLPKVEGKDVSSLGGSYQQALQRLYGLERKFRRHPEIKAQYTAFIREYADLNHMSLISPQVPEAKYFLPHHCVHKLDSTSTKLRVVFDGSAKTTSGMSLNDILYAGPSIQPKLFNTLVRYRFFKVALSGDICKMYRCVRVSHPDDYLQCILWRESEMKEVKVYKLNTVTYGTKPAAFLAIRAMHQLSIDEENCFPIGAKIVRRDFYVDDMISGGNSVEEALAIRQQVSALLKRGNFLIRKWCSNEPAVLEGVPVSDCEQFLKFHDGTDITKTLGLIWDPKSDNFIFSFNPINDWKVVTKRTILSSIARLYDPLGLIGPVITKAKIFMQHLWKQNLDWDESLPQMLHSSWIDYISKFDSVHRFTFPRYVSVISASTQIHGFCDASLAAYGACVYVRSEIDGISLETTMSWRYVPTKLNPADILSRGATPEELLKSPLWNSGPDFLLSESAAWPGSKEYLKDLPERRRNVLLTTTLTDLSIQCSSEALTPDDIKTGTTLLIKNIQQVCFSEEYRTLKANKAIPSYSKLSSLMPMVDDNGLIRVGGRLQNSNLEFDAQDPDDLDVLTPGHFLVGGPLISIPEPNMTWVNFGRLNSWQRVSELQQIFWRKWSSSYLSLLQERTKWQAKGVDISLGSLVLIKDDNLPPLKWQLGRVIEIIKGQDEVARVVNIRTSCGIFKRAVTNLALLPIDFSVEAPSTSTGGGC
ncbi:uncharacterized protein LOC131996094 [Stomoxys calcitrans]|uniref:uncharacterized protein LOC131996094 n=1 Tax=Stomoxys calcitrans TaxID=35570 RepID=UPI0027E2CE73|nr:uncharacterized protein LOC131996094 [Stomoxys calcitrans]